MESTKKTKWKQFFKALGFALTLAAVLVAISFALTPKNRGKYSSSRTHEISLVFNEPKNSLDVLVVGHSGVYGGVSPMEMYAQNGITSFDCSQSLQMPIESYRFIVDMLTVQTPKVIVLEVDQLFYDQKAHRKYKFGRAVLNGLPIVENHVAWKNGFRDKQRSVAKGYRFTVDCSPYTGDKVFCPSEEVYEIYPKYLRQFEKIAELCRDKQIKLLLLELPSKVFWDGSRYNAVRNFGDRYGLPLLDMNQCDEIGIDWQKDTRDGGNHLNYFGAVKASRYLGDYLKEHYNLDDRRGDPAFSSWETDYAAYKKIVEEGLCE